MANWGLYTRVLLWFSQMYHTKSARLIMSEYINLFGAGVRTPYRIVPSRDSFTRVKT
jgi:hypothetical protein